MQRTGSRTSVKCIFKIILKTCSNGVKSPLKSLSVHQVAVVLKSRNKSCDGFAEDINNANNNKLKYHSNFYSTCTSSAKIEQCITTKRNSKDRQSISITSPPTKWLRTM